MCQVFARREAQAARKPLWHITGPRPTCYPPGRGRCHAGQHAQQGRLAAAVRSLNLDQPTGVEVLGDVANDPWLTQSVTLAYRVQPYGGSLTAGQPVFEMYCVTNGGTACAGHLRCKMRR